MAGTDLYALGMALDEIKSQELTSRVASVKLAKKMAQRLGPLKTREELMLYLYESMDDDEKVLVEIARQLPGMVTEIGGLKYIDTLLFLFEGLLASEDEAVRTESIVSLLTLITEHLPEQPAAPQHPTAHLNDGQKHFLDMIVKFLSKQAESDFILNRASSAYLYPEVYRRIPIAAVKDSLALQFETLSRDPSTLVRKSVCHILSNGISYSLAYHTQNHRYAHLELAGKKSQEGSEDSKHDRIFTLGFVDVAEIRHIQSHLEATIVRYTQDPQVTVRFYAVYAAVTLFARLRPYQHGDAPGSLDVSQLVRTLCTDPSWRVKYTAANLFPMLQEGLLPNIMEPTDVLDRYKSLLSDSEANVRVAAALNLYDFCRLFILKQAPPAADSTIRSNNTHNSVTTNNNIGAATSDVLGDGETSQQAQDNFLYTTSPSHIRFMPSIAATLADLETNPQRIQPSAVDLVIKRLIPTIELLANDEDDQVRQAIATNILHICPLLGRQNAELCILQIFQTLLNDQFHETKFAILKEIHSASSIFEIDLISQYLLPSISSLSEDPNWRVRKGLIDLLPTLAKHLGREFFSYNKDLPNICINWCLDSVFTVREAAIANIKSLVTIFGADWAAESLLFPLLARTLDSNEGVYLNRLTTLVLFDKIADCIGTGFVISHLAPLTLRLLSDSVLNVRATAIKTLATIAKVLYAAYHAAESEESNGLKPEISMALASIGASYASVAEEIAAATKSLEMAAAVQDIKAHLL